MIISKTNEQGKRELYNHVIGAEDVKITYKDDNGSVITLEDKDTYRCAPNRTIKRDSDGKVVNVMSGDDCLIGNLGGTPSPTSDDGGAEYDQQEEEVEEPEEPED